MAEPTPIEMFAGRRRWINGLLALGGVVMALLPIEWYLRHTQRIYPPMWVRDATIGTRLVANHSFIDRSPGEFALTYRINSRGFRDDEFGDKRAGTARVLVLGDSYTFGIGVPRGETYPDRLEARLAAPGRPVEVINTGVGGWGTSHQLAFLEREGLTLAPDLILVGFFCNDFSDNAGAGLHRLRNGRLERIAPGARAAWLTLEAIPPALSLYQDLLQHVAVLAWARMRYVNWRDGPHRTRVSQRAVEPRHRALPDVARVDLTRHLLRRLHAVAADARVPVTLVLIPAHWEAGAPPETIGQELNAIRAMCQTDGFRCIDLAATFRGAGRDPGELYYAVDRHWRPLAHELAAAAIAEYLDAHRELLPGRG